VCAVALSQDGARMATGCGANTVKFWNASSLTHSLRTVSYHESVIRTLCFSPDGATLASGSEDNTVKLWNARTFQQVGSFKLHDHIRLVLFSPDGNNLAIVTDHGRLELLRASPLEEADREARALLK
jgi:WD40 repeat protein